MDFRSQLSQRIAAVGLSEGGDEKLKWSHLTDGFKKKQTPQIKTIKDLQSQC